MLNYDYIKFLDEKILEHIPQGFVRVGDKINIRCPICGDSKKSARKKRGWIYLKNASYYCFNCSTGMSGMKFLQFISGQDYEDIKKECFKLFLKSRSTSSLSSYFDDADSSPNVFDVKSIINPDWKKPLTEDAKRYLEGRKVLDAPFLQDPLYSCFNSKTNQEYILIPWILNGVEAYYQINDFKKYGDIKYIFPKGKQKLLAGLDNIDISWPYIICFEGFYDSLFVKNGICVGTKAITDYQAKLIKDRYPHHQIVVSFDNDSAGLQSMAKLVKYSKDVKYFKWFDENTAEKDINDYILSKGDVNIFSDAASLEKLIVDKLRMKMFLIMKNSWRSASL